MFAGWPDDLLLSFPIVRPGGLTAAAAPLAYRAAALSA